jgi:hypothetical protein
MEENTGTRLESWCLYFFFFSVSSCRHPAGSVRFFWHVLKHVLKKEYTMSRYEFVVEFERELGDDKLCAKDNYPYLPLEYALVMQFCDELRENEILDGLWKLKKVEFILWEDTEWFNVKFSFKRQTESVSCAKKWLESELQKTYDEYHMAGFYKIFSSRKMKEKRNV